jgi:hypothetical protein
MQTSGQPSIAALQEETQRLASLVERLAQQMGDMREGDSEERQLREANRLYLNQLQELRRETNTPARKRKAPRQGKGSRKKSARLSTVAAPGGKRGRRPKGHPPPPVVYARNHKYLTNIQVSGPGKLRAFKNAIKAAEGEGFLQGKPETENLVNIISQGMKQGITNWDDFAIPARYCCKAF